MLKERYVMVIENKETRDDNKEFCVKVERRIELATDEGVMKNRLDIELAPHCGYHSVLTDFGNEKNIQFNYNLEYRELTDKNDNGISSVVYDTDIEDLINATFYCNGTYKYKCTDWQTKEKYIRTETKEKKIKLEKMAIDTIGDKLDYMFKLELLDRTTKYKVQEKLYKTLNGIKKAIRNIDLSKFAFRVNGYEPIISVKGAPITRNDYISFMEKNTGFGKQYILIERDYETYHNEILLGCFRGYDYETSFYLNHFVIKEEKIETTEKEEKIAA